MVDSIKGMSSLAGSYAIQAAQTGGAGKTSASAGTDGTQGIAPDKSTAGKPGADNMSTQNTRIVSANAEVRDPVAASSSAGESGRENNDNRNEESKEQRTSLRGGVDITV